ncbi:hypothetical protein D7M11_25955 [Paenibacillus ginsengarvi]|uniref:Restriction endonuclease n=2 Tax=Paenibacillus ginsengarvi TaxID=400777 RepID=A0A3B0BTM8_9BACL|nr:hypothetical protein D7M11_25955 [Paenibacillus ginsengarvi]
MARRRRRKKEASLLEGLLGFGMLGVGLLTYKVTDSIKISFVACGALLGIVISVIIMRNVAYTERLKKSGIADIDKMEGREFEHYLGHLFKSHGYDVKVTQAAGDFGADLVISKDGKKIVVQAKRYSKNVGIKAVQETHSSMGYYKAGEAWVVTNSKYTDAARELANSLNVKLIGREQLIDLILKQNPQNNTQAAQSTVPEQLPQKEEKRCPKCGAPMVRRKSSMGYFLGCENFPKCKSTQVI